MMSNNGPFPSTARPLNRDRINSHTDQMAQGPFLDGTVAADAPPIDGQFRLEGIADPKPVTEYEAGRVAAYAWLAGDGRGYLDPDNDDDLECPDIDDRDDVFVQGFDDALKGTSWHAQNPGKLCYHGEECLDRKWLNEQQGKANTGPDSEAAG